MGLPDSIYKVEKISFDDLNSMTGKFDLVLGNECFLHSANRDSLISNVSRLLEKGGIFYFSDIL